MQKKVSGPSLTHGAFSGCDRLFSLDGANRVTSEYFHFFLFAVILTPAHIRIVFLQQQGGEVGKIDFAPIIFHNSGY